MAAREPIVVSEITCPLYAAWTLSHSTPEPLHIVKFQH